MRNEKEIKNQNEKKNEIIYIYIHKHTRITSDIRVKYRNPFSDVINLLKAPPFSRARLRTHRIVVEKIKTKV